MSEKLELPSSSDSIYFTDRDSVRLLGKGLNINMVGGGNRIVIGRNVVINSLSVVMNSNNNLLVIGDDCRVTGSVIMKISDGNEMVVESKTTIGGANFICGEGTKISIGSDCMIAWGIEFRTTDSHAIISRESGERINEASDICIGNHVWIGAHCTILKGSSIGNDSVVSIRSLVNKEFQEDGIVIAGVPAKIVKRGVTWNRPLLG